MEFTGSRALKRLTGTHEPKQSVQPTTQLSASADVETAAFAEQVARYRAWLLADYQFNNTASNRQQVREYAENAMKPVMVGSREIRTFALFRPELSALKTLKPGQALIIVLILAGCALWLLADAVGLLVAFLAVVTVYYLSNLILTFALSARTLEHSAEESIDNVLVEALADAEWPRYTILCPLYREARVVPQFVEAMQALDYPADKLQILFLTEENDQETRDAILARKLPRHFEVVTVPPGTPQTKPRACNYGLLKATGDYVVIYDAEDKPDPLQLKKAILTFANHGSELGCVQAKLNFYNTDQNILTRWFTAEYSAWFEMTLPGLQWANMPLPLGGTSNHFRTKALITLGAWDAFNVTEDCDLGLRLAHYGYHTVVLDSITFEEANPRPKNWIRQRSRWIKGYMQTYLVHMRQPLRYLPPARWRDFFSLQIIVGGKTAVLLINPLMWALLIIYFIFRPRLDPIYHALFPALVLYMGTICLIFGNLMYVYIHFVGCMKRNQYSLVKWTLLMPFYWGMSSAAAFVALYQLITKPHYWEKTSHGLHLPGAPAQEAAPQPSAEAKRLSAAVAISETAEMTLRRTVELPVPRVEPPPQDSSDTAAAPVESSANGDHLVGLRRRRALALPLPKDPWLTLTILVACITSVGSLIYYFSTHQLLLYGDANSHLAIARRVIDNATPGVAQLGGIWLPLPHLAMLPFVWNDFLWRTGLAGSFVSMPCYVITAIFIFTSTRRLTKNDSRASFIGALLFIFNPNILYLQTTALSEMVFIATMAIAGYFYLAWIQDYSPKRLIPAAAATFLATMARYDGWPLFIAFFGLILIIGLLRRQHWDRIEGSLIVYGTLGALGIVLWFLWCAVIFGDPLYFQHSEFSAQAQQTALLAAHQLYTYHDLWQSIRYFGIASIDVIGPGLSALSLFALLFYLVRSHSVAERLVTLTFLIPAAFYVFSLYTGQAALFVPGAVPNNSSYQMFNVRYGSVVVLPAAVFVGALIHYLTRARQPSNERAPLLPQLTRRGLQNAVRLAFIAVIAVQSVWISTHGIIVLQSGQFGTDCMPLHPIDVYMAQHYEGGRLLGEAYASLINSLGPDAGVSFKNIVYEGSGPLWKQMLTEPAPDVAWIIMNPTNPNDAVSQHIDRNNPDFKTQFTLVMEEPAGFMLFHHNGLPPLPDRPVPDTLYAEHQLCKG